MTIVVRRDVLAGLGARGTALVEVRSADPAAAAVVREVLAGRAKYVSPPHALPSGWLVVVDPDGVDPDLDRVENRLRDAGVADVEVTLAPRVDELPLRSAGPVARAWLRAPLAQPLGDAVREAPLWLGEVALDWVNSPEAVGVVVSAQVPAPAVLPALETGAPVAVVGPERAAAVTGGFRDVLPAATLTAAGDVVAEMVALRSAVLASSARLAWAGVSADVDGRDVLSATWEDREGTRPDVERLPDFLVPDALWCQLLTAGHVDRLGGVPDGAREVPGGWELTVGSPEQWVPGHPESSAVRAHARSLLAACLVSRDEEQSLSRERLQQARARDASFFRRS
ncbi:MULTISPECIES: hypothetical protein [unclassified Saccharothrix]|uniref:hypothetical protein n=1 Tax=unclassified Saccharothrix TaxID=2593673 RepID=UPI00307E7A81